MSGFRRFRPNSLSLLAMIVVNGLAAGVVLKFLFALFGIGAIFPEWAAAHEWTRTAMQWELFWPLLPGAAIGFGCLWYWLILAGRFRGLPWGAACIYGCGVAFATVPLSGFLLGLQNGSPLLGLLIGLVMILVLPSLLAAMTCFGLAMGLLNGVWAQRWIIKNRPR